MPTVQLDHTLISTCRKSNQYYAIRGQRRGSAAVESALILPLLVFILIGALDVGQAINLRQNVENASREGARLISKDITESATSVQNAIEEYLAEAYPNVADETWSKAISINFTDTSLAEEETDTESTSSAFKLMSVESGNTILVEVTVDYTAIRWVRGLDFWSDSFFTSSTMCRRE